MSAPKSEEMEASKWRWSQELKEHFVKAFEILQNRGIHATPKKIMGLMRQNGAPIEQLTMRRVQSHHQKYLKRLKTAKLGGKKLRQFPKPIKPEASDSGHMSDRFDLEVSHITASIDNSSCHTSPRGSPMIFVAQSPPSNIRGSPTSSPPLTFAHGVHKQAALPINVLRPQSAPPSFAAHLPATFSPVNPAMLPSRPVKFNPETFSSLAQQNPTAMLPYMMSETVVKPKPVPQLPSVVQAVMPSFCVSSSSAFATKLAPGPLAAAPADDLSSRFGTDLDSNIFGDLLSSGELMSFSRENSILDTFSSSSQDLDVHIEELFPESCVSSDDDSFDFLGFDNNSVLDFVS